MRHSFIALLAILGLGVSMAQAEPNLVGYWALTEMDGAAPQNDVTLRIRGDKRISGTAPCNRYFSNWQGRPSDFATGPIGATKMACPNLQQETRYFELLSSMTHARRMEAELVLSNDDGARLVFRLSPPRG